MPTLVLIVLFLIGFENQCFIFLKTVITNSDTLPKKAVSKIETAFFIL